MVPAFAEPDIHSLSRAFAGRPLERHDSLGLSIRRQRWIAHDGEFRNLRATAMKKPESILGFFGRHDA
jgi:hypothetical protein